jgi:hypothetical protein
MGEVDFLQPGFGKADWVHLRAPWPAASSGKTSIANTPSVLQSGRVGLGPGHLPSTSPPLPYLEGKIHDLLPSAWKEPSGNIYFDVPNWEPGGFDENRDMQCVVLGIEKGPQPVTSRRHYFILVKQLGNTLCPEVSGLFYRRVGAGYLPGRCIAEGGCVGRIH